MGNYNCHLKKSCENFDEKCAVCLNNSEYSPYKKVNKA